MADPRGKHQHGLREANLAFYRAFERLDLEAMSKLWARSVEVTCVHPGWDIVIGYDAVMQSWQTIFDGTSEIRFRLDDPRITASEQMGWVVCRELLYTTVNDMPIENLLPTINAFVLEQGEYRIAHHHAAPLLAGKPRVVRPPPSILH
jgi:hypothetical protein